MIRSTARALNRQVWRPRYSNLPALSVYYSRPRGFNLNHLRRYSSSSEVQISNPGTVCDHKCDCNNKNTDSKGTATSESKGTATSENKNSESNSKAQKPTVGEVQKQEKSQLDKAREEYEINKLENKKLIQDTFTTVGLVLGPMTIGRVLGAISRKISDFK